MNLLKRQENSRWIQYEEFYLIIMSDFKEDNSFATVSTESKDSIQNGRWNTFISSFKRAEEIDDELALEKTNLSKGLKKRQLQMIALGGCVGSGLLVASGMALKNGPASLLVAWAVVSSFLYCTMQSLAELSAAFPVSGSFATHSSRFIDRSWGFAMGWNYAMFWIIVLPLELVASSITIKFWQSDINSVVWVAVFYVLIIVLNLCGNKGFGETEFIASIIKLLGIVGFNILAVILICGGGDEGIRQVLAQSWSLHYRLQGCRRCLAYCHLFSCRYRISWIDRIRISRKSKKSFANGHQTSVLENHDFLHVDFNLNWIFGSSKLSRAYRWKWRKCFSIRHCYQSRWN